MDLLELVSWEIILVIIFENSVDFLYFELWKGDPGNSFHHKIINWLSRIEEGPILSNFEAVSGESIFSSHKITTL